MAALTHKYTGVHYSRKYSRLIRHPFLLNALRRFCALALWTTQVSTWAIRSFRRPWILPRKGNLHIFSCSRSRELFVRPKQKKISQIVKLLWKIVQSLYLFALLFGMISLLDKSSERRNSSSGPNHQDGRLRLGGQTELRFTNENWNCNWWAVRGRDFFSQPSRGNTWIQTVWLYLQLHFLGYWWNE